MVLFLSGAGHQYHLACIQIGAYGFRVNFNFNPRVIHREREFLGCVVEEFVNKLETIEQQELSGVSDGQLELVSYGKR